MHEAGQKKFLKLVREIGRLIRTEAVENLSARTAKPSMKRQMEGTLWSSVFLEARWFANAAGYTAKLRVVLPDGSLHSLRTTNELDLLLDKLSRMRKELSSTVWYGLTITTNFKGVVATDFNYNPNCVVDPAWFSS